MGEGYQGFLRLSSGQAEFRSQSSDGGAAFRAALGPGAEVVVAVRAEAGKTSRARGESAGGHNTTGADDVIRRAPRNRVHRLRHPYGE
jgi:hypothetical protein